MHLEGYDLTNGKVRSPDEAYNGKSTLIFAKLIKQIIQNNNILTMLDYGCGKGYYYENPFNKYDVKSDSLRNYWGIDIDLYDPCFQEYSKFNDNKDYDLIICIDVLEHIPLHDISRTLQKISSLVKQGGSAFLVIASDPSKHENHPERSSAAVELEQSGLKIHETVKPRTWWLSELSKNAKSKVEESRIPKVPNSQSPKVKKSPNPKLTIRKARMLKRRILQLPLLKIFLNRKPISRYLTKINLISMKKCYAFVDLKNDP